MHGAIDPSLAFVIAMGIIFIAPWAIWRLLDRDDCVPLVVVQIVTGIVLGPGLLGRWLPQYYLQVFQPPVMSALNGVATWGVLLFICGAGAELDLRKAWAARAESALTAALALGVPLVCGSLVAAALLKYPGWRGASAAPWQFVLSIGMTCAVTAVPVLILFMEKLELLDHPLGQRCLRYASLDDIAIWAVLGIILLDWTRLARELAALVVITVAAILVRRGMPRLRPRDRWYVAFMWLLACAAIAEWAGLHYLVGAFLAGAVLDADWFGRVELASLRRFVLLTLMPVFFLATGLRTNWNLGGLAVLLAAAFFVGAAVGGKLLGTQLAARLLGWSRGEAAIIGWLLQNKGLVMIVFADVLLDKHLISDESFTALLIMGLVSTVLTVPMVAPRLARVRATSLETA
jgi:Kef-type K+ transport system membrane component KefB